ncbi:MAG: hypothetical protein KJ583_01180 [Nanoarchaeota archaeon]|nr:hypothetical protein [Nanoarchaeota archaeon]MBU1270504.1 hypothetical protein [Nanoarchaeota archaeon]MBU1603904.1 hypothetical protein [Nanoarchaeota archaeon]MBU2442658.1 hypothetical protein [Nanoarchaeota archaeon]
MGTIFRPNNKKVMQVSLVKIASFVLIFIVILVILQLAVGLSVFTDILAPFGITIDGSDALLWSIIFIFMASLLVLAWIYLSIINERYEFFDDKLIAYKTALLVFSNSKEISYQKISKVWFENKGFFDGLFNTGTIILDLSSMTEKELRMNYMDKLDQSADLIQQILRSYQLKTQAVYTEKYKIDGILSRGGL